MNKTIFAKNKAVLTVTENNLVKDFFAKKRNKSGGTSIKVHVIRNEIKIVVKS